MPLQVLVSYREHWGMLPPSGLSMEVSLAAVKPSRCGRRRCLRPPPSLQWATVVRSRQRHAWLSRASRVHAIKHACMKCDGFSKWDALRKRVSLGSQVHATEHGCMYFRYERSRANREAQARNRGLAVRPPLR